MLIHNGLWDDGSNQQLGESDVLTLTLDRGRRYASADWIKGREPIARMIPDNHVGWIVEFDDETPTVTSSGCGFLLHDKYIIAALMDISENLVLDRIEFVRLRIANYDQMTLPDHDREVRHTCVTVLSSMAPFFRQTRP